MRSDLTRNGARLAGLLVLAAALAAAAPSAAQESAWEERVRRDPRVTDNPRLDPLTRRVLHAVTPEQAAALADGAAPEEIRLEGGETLADYLARTVSGGPGLVYEPVDQCKLFNTVMQTAPVTGPMAANETREYVVRGAGAAHTDQGGAPTCLIPDEAVAVVMHFRVTADAVQGAQGYLRAWAADAPEPSTPVTDYAPVVDPPLTSRVRRTGTAVIELCPLAACAGGEIKVRTVLLGGHVRGDVAGFFRPTVAADVPEAGNAQTLGGMDKSAFADAVHTHDGGDIVSGTVGEPFIDPTIARDAEILPIVLDNDGPGSLLDGDLVDGRQATDLMRQVGNCLQVSPSCPAGAAEALELLCWQTISAALAEIGAGLPAASAGNRYLIKVGPGVYADQVNMVPFVDIEGAGQKVTTITDDGSVSPGTMRGADNVELRHLTVESTGPAAGSSIAFQTLGNSPMLRHVTLLAKGGANNLALVNAPGSVLSLVHVTATAAAETAFDAALENQTATVVVRDSFLEGDDGALVNNTSATANVTNTQLVGPASETGGGNVFACLGAFDGAFAELGTDCQP